MELVKHTGNVNKLIKPLKMQKNTEVLKTQVKTGGLFSQLKNYF